MSDSSNLLQQCVSTWGDGTKPTTDNSKRLWTLLTSLHLPPLVDTSIDRYMKHERGTLSLGFRAMCSATRVMWFLSILLMCLTPAILMGTYVSIKAAFMAEFAFIAMMLLIYSPLDDFTKKHSDGWKSIALTSHKERVPEWVWDHVAILKKEFPEVEVYVQHLQLKDQKSDYFLVVCHDGQDEFVARWAS